MRRTIVKCTCVGCHKTFTETNYFKDREQANEWAQWAEENLRCPDCERGAFAVQYSAFTLARLGIELNGEEKDLQYAYVLLRNVSRESIQTAKEEISKIDDSIVEEVAKVTGDTKESIIRDLLKRKGLLSEYAILNYTEAKDIIELLAPKGGICFDYSELWFPDVKRSIRYGTDEEIKEATIAPNRYTKINYPKCATCGNPIKDYWITHSGIDENKLICGECFMKAYNERFPKDENTEELYTQLSLFDFGEISKAGG